ncbi:MarR family transcriptional regulator (plasmid) [Georgenia sp. TF02-10]|uniref:MarR family winged helix-turn-helix transcriptional regulator n=1 Tax=Georgenia sp. TF02-10 TaxID=2917725 RepID=UPI001FA792F1|nr:MarR family transcriptional regulator [Georgenia sp. TF02-10]UNX56618.1 MarR family transcriptional regulator [Georgenia sp. TF02-10]
METRQAQATEAMMAVSPTMTAIVARTLSEVADELTVPQLRVLVLLNSRGPMNLTTIAQHLHVNASNASRTCDQLVAAGRISRQPDPDDRRSAVLRLTDEGGRLLAGIMTARRRLIDGVVVRMDPEDQQMLAEGLAAFTATVAAMPPEESIGLPDGRLIPWLL